MTTIEYATQGEMDDAFDEQMELMETKQRLLDDIERREAEVTDLTDSLENAKEELADLRDELEDLEEQIIK